MTFFFDTFTNSQKLKRLAMIDEPTKKSLLTDVAGSIRDKKDSKVLKAVAAERGYPPVL
jgi:hypothetical protein